MTSIWKYATLTVMFKMEATWKKWSLKPLDGSTSMTAAKSNLKKCTGSKTKAQARS